MQDFLRTCRRLMSQPAFVVVALILLLSAVGLQGAIQQYKLFFKKLPVPLAQPLTSVPRNLGPWVQVSEDEPLAHEIEDALATKMYIFRDFVDTRIVGQQKIDEFKNKSASERKRLLFQLQVEQPTAVINASVTYYTGSVDTVAHVPERCYVADGYEADHPEDVSWDVLKGRPGNGMLRYINFADTTPGRYAFTRNVAYVFQCNGEYINDSIEVRTRLANLRQKYGYYMKVEVQTFNLQKAQAAGVMNDFLKSLLPETEKCLADWNALKSGQ